MVKIKKTELNLSSHPSFSATRPANMRLANTIMHDSSPADLTIEDKTQTVNPETLRKADEPATQVNPPNPIDMNSLYPSLVADDFPNNSFIATVVGSRRTGKSSVTESLLVNELKDRFNTYFLFSPTLSGFDSIPNNFKFRDLSLLPNIIKKQQEAVKHNISVTKLLTKKNLTKRQKGQIEKTYKDSKICFILDDMLGTGALKNNKLLNKLACNGRHVCSGDKSGRTDCSFFILSQSVVGVDTTIRRNSDLIISSRLTSKKDRTILVEENMILDSSRGGITAAYDQYDQITLNRDFAFISLLNHKSNKSKYENYLRSYNANMASFTDIPVRLGGTDADWEAEKPFFDFCS